ncbi:hypothetical protein OQA88_2371 [Cercophora sp. LCS_1]
MRGSWELPWCDVTRLTGVEVIPRTASEVFGELTGGHICLSGFLVPLNGLAKDIRRKKMKWDVHLPRDKHQDSLADFDRPALECSPAGYDTYVQFLPSTPELSWPEGASPLPLQCMMYSNRCHIYGLVLQPSDAEPGAYTKRGVFKALGWHFGGGALGPFLLEGHVPRDGSIENWEGAVELRII